MELGNRSYHSFYHSSSSSTSVANKSRIFSKENFFLFFDLLWSSLKERWFLRLHPRLWLDQFDLYPDVLSEINRDTGRFFWAKSAARMLLLRQRRPQVQKYSSWKRNSMMWSRNILFDVFTVLTELFVCNHRILFPVAQRYWSLLLEGCVFNSSEQSGLSCVLGRMRMLVMHVMTKSSYSRVLNLIDSYESFYHLCCQQIVCHHRNVERFFQVDLALLHIWAIINRART